MQLNGCVAGALISAALLRRKKNALRRQGQKMRFKKAYGFFLIFFLKKAYGFFLIFFLRRCWVPYRRKKNAP
jgi:hypothetical protein